MYMCMVYLYFRRQFEAVLAYVMSQRWLGTQAFLTMPVKEAPRFEKRITIVDLNPFAPLHLHVIGSILGYRCRCGEPSFS